MRVGIANTCKECQLTLKIQSIYRMIYLPRCDLGDARDGWETQRPTKGALNEKDGLQDIPVHSSDSIGCYGSAVANLLLRSPNLRANGHTNVNPRASGHANDASNAYPRANGYTHANTRAHGHAYANPRANDASNVNTCADHLGTGGACRIL